MASWQEPDKGQLSSSSLWPSCPDGSIPVMPQREGGLGPRQHYLSETEEPNALLLSYKVTAILSNEDVAQGWESRGFYAQLRQELAACWASRTQ